MLDASDGPLTIDDVNPVWFQTPAAPFAAALVEQRDVDVQQICERLEALRARFDFVVVEGVGGWLVPIQRDYFISDLAVAMGLPVLVVALNRLGCLNHTLLTVQSIAASRLRCVSIALNDGPAAEPDIAVTTNSDVLKRVCAVPVLAGLTSETAVLPAEWEPVLNCQADTNVSVM